MPDDDVRATEAYLQGLSGRPALGGMDAPAHAEGATLREALLDGPEVPTRGADWQDVLAREAANEPAVRPRFWAGLAASVMAYMLAIWWFWPLDDNAMRGGGGAGGGGSPTALWRSAQPAQDASSLATQLRIAGAQVEVAAQTNGDVLMSVQAAAEARAAVDAQLAALDTALNAQGQVQIRVTAAP